ncbi:MAG: ubiquinone/menaquinone biosynthesis methyltransferase [Chloroflexi bacterium]|nr:ubiquinone/menaquinone biosynthesis methyltransferase [Chloroflexota bacterium]
MFGRIVPRYDLLNSVLTAGFDRRWRERAAALAAPNGARVLDLGTGTGMLADALVARGARILVGGDFSLEMLQAARRRVSVRLLTVADALDLPFADATFDVVTSAFLWRNLADLPAGLAELARVLRPGGRVVSLEVTHPPGWRGPVFRLYFERVVPIVGGLVSGDPVAYGYLPASLGHFPPALQLADLLAAAGFERVSFQYVGLGGLAIHLAHKPDAPAQKHASALQP